MAASVDPHVSVLAPPARSWCPCGLYAQHHDGVDCLVISSTTPMLVTTSIRTVTFLLCFSFVIPYGLFLRLFSLLQLLIGTLVLQHGV